MAYLSLSEYLRVMWVRPDVLSDLTWIMAEFERRTGKKTEVPDDGNAVRTFAQQQQEYADSLEQGFRAAPPGESRHEYGSAFHLQIVGAPVVDGRVPAGSQSDYETLAAVAESRGYLAGLHFKTGKPDAVHYEKDEPLSVAKTKWAELTRGRLQRGALLLAVVVALGALTRTYFSHRRHS